MEVPLENEGIKGSRRTETLYDVIHRMLSMIFFPDSDSSAPLLKRIKNSLSENACLLKDATSNTGRKVLLWARRGSPLRALLVISVGTIALLTLTGLLVFMLFFLAATANAVVVSLLISLAAVGGFMALFFALITAIYIWALSVAVFVISTATISAIIAVFIATGVAMAWWPMGWRNYDLIKIRLTPSEKRLIF
ncbi:hypothetical protein GH714_033399 [Hevea brasiliensis]|uniref:Uncharacterized protein n=1 Tax=Hevea brasiliensis TaxID=3981 RepID=A0A6A6MS59_HEVBR|nr:hypothetical protein GH714_033399 [Hevea brasiliensis]